MSKVLQERGSGSLLSSTETNPRDHVKSITTTDEADTPSICRIEPTRYGVSSQQKDDKMQLIKLSRASVPFPGRLKEYGYDEEEVLKGLQKLQVNLAESATSLKRLLKEKTRIEEEIKATMNKHYSAIIKDDLPLKVKDPGSFTLPCKINDICFDKALADLGASVSFMPYSTFTNLGLGKLAPTKLIIELPDKIVKHPDEVFSIWKAFGGNTRDLGSFGEETDKITNQHQDSSRFKVSEPGDGVTIYTRRRHTTSIDGVTTFLDGVSPYRLNSDVEDSTLRRRHD
ncbi:DNA/RNA polymerases superfamily protein [Tanacetum coccineum]